MAAHILDAIEHNGTLFGYLPREWTGKKLRSQSRTCSTLRPVYQWQHDEGVDALVNRSNYKRCVLDKTRPDRDMRRVCHPNNGFAYHTVRPVVVESFYKRMKRVAFERRNAR